MMQRAPALAASSKPSGKGKKASDAQAEWVSFAFECVFATLFLAEMLVKMVALGACDIA